MTMHSIDRTYEREDYLGTVTHSAEVRIWFTYAAGRAAQVFGRNEDCYPEDPAEIEFVKAEEEHSGEMPRWQPAQPGLVEWAEDWLNDHPEQAMEVAAEDQRADYEDAMDRRAEERAERDWER